MKKILEFIFNVLRKLGLFNWINDEKYLKLLYYIRMGKKINLNNPILFSEKLQWLKLHDRKDIYTNMVDKYEAKKYVAKIIGEEYIIPTIGVYNSFDDIDFDKLPNQFVIKCTHDSGGLVIVKDKKNINIKNVRKKIKKSLKRNYYYGSREWPYKNVKPRVIVEKYMEDYKDATMRDYKFFCFNGTPRIMYISEGLEDHKTASMSFFDMDYKVMNCKRKDYKLLNNIPSKPITFNKMKKFASILSKNIPHVRVDFYEINGKLYFGELTFFTCSGFIPFEDEKWDKIMGDYINLGGE